MDGKVRLWEVATGSLRCEVPGKEVLHIVFSVDGKILATNHVTTGDVQLWDWWDLGLPQPKWLPKQRDQLWNELAAQDAAVAYRAMTLLCKVPKKAVELLGARLQGAPPISPTELDQLIADLNHDDFARREKASEQLIAVSVVAEKKLRTVLARTSSAEVRSRIRKLLDLFGNGGGPEHLRRLRGVEFLEHLGTREAQGVLARLAAGTADRMPLAEARAALQRLKSRPGNRP